MDRILVTGASGQQGGAVARALLARGHGVLAVTRNAGRVEELRDLGAEVAVCDLADRPSLDAVLSRARRIFLVTTPFEGGAEAEIAQGRAMAEAAKAAGIEHLVFSSIGSADRGTGIPHFESKAAIERILDELKIPTTVIRPTFFMENFRAGWIAPMLHAGRLRLPLPGDCTLQMIALEDVAEFVAAALLKPEEFIGQSIDLAGDERKMAEIATILSRPFAHGIKYERMPEEEAERAFGADTAAMFRWLAKVGHRVHIEVVERGWEMPLTRFADWAAKTDWKLAA